MSDEYSNRILYELGAVTAAAGVILLRLAVQRSWGHYDRTREDLRGLTIVITGASSGLGKQTAIEMLKRGARIIIGCRNDQTAIAALKDIQSEAISQKQKSTGEIIYRNLDLCSFDSVVNFANVIQEEPRIDILINNAGVYCPPFHLTPDGFETTIQANHLGHSLLTSLLLPKLATTGTDVEPARVVMVSSTHYMKGTVQQQDFEKNGTYPAFDGRAQYNNSKLAMAAFSRYLSDKISAHELPIRTYTVSPGLVYTKLGRHMKQNLWRSLIFLPFALIFLRTPYQGCQTVLQCALSTRLRQSTGEIYRNCHKVGGRGPLASLDEPDTVNRVGSLTIDAIKSRLTPEAKAFLL